MDEEGAVHKIWELDEEYPMLNTEDRTEEEWPSEKWDFTGKCKNFWGKGKKAKTKTKKLQSAEEHSFEEPSDAEPVRLKEEDIVAFIREALGEKKSKKILEQIDAFNFAYELDNNPDALLEIKGIKEKTLNKLLDKWSTFKKERLEASV